MPFEVINAGDGSYNIPGGLYVVRDQSELEAFWTRLQELRGQSPAPPVVAWSSVFALFVLLGTRATGGYRVSIEQVALNGNDVRVCALELTPPAEAATTQALTAPYQMATVPKFNGTAELSMRSEPRW